MSLPARDQLDTPQQWDPFKGWLQQFWDHTASLPYSNKGRGAWAAGANYAAGDYVERSGALYIAQSAHVAGGSFTADVAAGRWTFLDSALAAAVSINAKVAAVDGQIQQVLDELNSEASITATGQNRAAAKASEISAALSAQVSQAAGRGYPTVAAANADAGLPVGASFAYPLPDGSFQAAIKTGGVGSTPTLIGAPFPTLASALAAIQLSNMLATWQQQVFGTQGALTTGTAIPTASYAYVEFGVRENYLHAINAFVMAIGQLKIQAITLDASRNFAKVGQPVTVNFGATGSVTLFEGIDFPQLFVPLGGALYFYVPASGGAQLAFKLSSGVSQHPYVAAVGDIGNSGTFNPVDSTRDLQINFVMRGAAIPQRNLDLALSEKIETGVKAAATAAQFGLAVHGGQAYPFVAPILDANNNFTFILSPFQGSSMVVNKLYIDVLLSGIGVFEFVRLNANGLLDVLASFQYTFGAGGAVEIGAAQGFNPVSLPPNCSVAYRRVSGNARIRYSLGSLVSFYTFQGTLAPTGNDIGVAAPNNICLGYDATLFQVPVAAIPADIARVADYQAALQSAVRTLRTPRVVLDASRAFTSLPANWINTDSNSFSFSSAGATSIALGLSKQLRSNFRRGMEKRTIHWEFQITADGSVVALLTNPTEGATQAGGLITFDTRDNKLKRWPRYVGAAYAINPITDDPIEAIPLNFIPVVGRTYIVEVVLNGRTCTMRAGEKDGPGFCEATRTATPRGWGIWNVAGTQYYDQGMHHGCPGIAALAGGVIVKEFHQNAPYFAQPYLYIVGDSLTEGFGLTDAQKYATLIANRFAPGDVVSDGVGGAQSAGVLSRLIAMYESEMRPQNVLVNIGTNPDGSIAANLAAIRTLVQSKGGKLYVCTVARFQNATDAVLALPADVTKINMHQAFMVNGQAGGAPVTVLFNTTDEVGTTYSDGYHYGPLGSPQGVRRIEIDAPDLLPA